MVLSSTKHSSKSIVYHFLNAWLGTALLTSKGSKWHNRRKMLTSAFHFNILQQFMPIFVEESERLIRALEGECDKPFTNIPPLIAEFTLNTICETAMGTRLQNKDKRVREYRKALARIDELFIERLMRPWFYFDCVYFLSPDYREQKRLIKTLHTFSKSIIAERELNFDESEMIEAFCNEKFTTKARLAMLDLLIYAKRTGQPIDDEGIREEVDTFIFEGHDTTSACICFTLLMLSCHKDIQPNRLYSPHTIFIRQSGHSFEIATALCSLLIGLNYDAYVVSGYATQDVCLKIMTRVDSPFPPEKQEEEEVIKVNIDMKYMLKPAKDLRSKFLLAMEQREIDKAVAEKERIAEAERKRLEEIEKPPFDELYGQRVHAWVLILPGTRDVEKSIFIEPSTGASHPLNSPLYCGIESIWNHNNYWVNLQDCAKGLGNLDYDFSNVANWEHLIIGEPLKWRETKFSAEMEEDEIKLLTIMDEKHLDMPTPWSERISIPHSILKQRFPNGVKKAWYKRTMVEQFSPYVQPDGLVTRVCRYNDLECAPSELHTIEENYENRVDNLVKVISDCNTGVVTEHYKRGREDAVKLHSYSARDQVSVECERIIEYYHHARHDGLAKLVLNETYLTEHYVNTESRIFYRHVDFARRGEPPPGMLEGTRRIVVKIVEKYNRNEKKPASQDVAVREFAIIDREIHIKYHYEEGKVTASTRDFIKPPLAEMGDKLRFNPSLTNGYQAELGAKPSRQLQLFNLLEQQLEEEDQTLYHIREMEDQVIEFLKLRCIETAYPNLSISLFDRENNVAHRKGMKEREQKEREHREREVEDEIDYLAPYIARLGGPSRLTSNQAFQAREWCLSEFKQMLVNRANDIQQQFEKNSVKLLNNQEWYISVQDTLKVDEEARYFEETNNATFHLHSLEIRLARHRELSPYRYEALENYLKLDTRIAILYKK